MILAINTSTLQFGLALLREDGSVMADYLMSGDARHFGGVMSAFDFLLTSLKRDVKDLQAVVLAKGPGSFTGLRVGFALAKGLIHGLGVPVVGVRSLEALADQVSCASVNIVPILTSRRGEVFAARFSRKGEKLVREVEDASLRFEDLPSLCGGEALFVGNDFPGQGPMLKKVFGEGVSLAPPRLWNLTASSVGALGVRRLRKGDFDDPNQILPIYLRPPDIRPNPYPPAL